MRRVEHAVHVTGVRCDGRAHGNCDAGCMIFWREVWLKRVDMNVLNEAFILRVEAAVSANHLISLPGVNCSVEKLHAAACSSVDPSSADSLYTCQATELRKFTSHLSDWDLRQYLRDILSGNLSRGIAESKSEKLLEMMLGTLEIFRSLLILVFNKLQSVRKGVQYPHIEVALVTTPTAELKLNPGEFVQVKSKAEILATLNRRNRNRGLLFDSEMVKYCGGRFRGLKRGYIIVYRKTGKGRAIKYTASVLEGVGYASDYHRLCPRAIYHYWRESWLSRIE